MIFSFELTWVVFSYIMLWILCVVDTLWRGFLWLVGLFCSWVSLARGFLWLVGLFGSWILCGVDTLWRGFLCLWVSLFVGFFVCGFLWLVGFFVYAPANPRTCLVLLYRTFNPDLVYGPPVLCGNHCINDNISGFPR